VGRDAVFAAAPRAPTTTVVTTLERTDKHQMACG
jgi:hypothetical protein